jgi:hypothetical protein
METLQHDRTATLDQGSLASAIGTTSDGIHLNFWVREPDAVAALAAHAEGRDRDDYSRSALRIGILALQQAQGRLDADTIRSEGERLLATLDGRLHAHQSRVDSLVSGTLKGYFDPKDGRFTERVERLVKEDGELECLIRDGFAQAAKQLHDSLLSQVGPQSMLAKLLTPDDSNRLLIEIRGSVENLVDSQRTKLLGEFSLDNKSGALARLVAELQVNNGAFADRLKNSVDEVVQEFSLDKEDSALSRLVKRVERTQQQINAEFSLDAQDSALSRMKRDLMNVVETHQRQTIDFQTKVVAALDAMKARREESLAATRHGHDFELAVYEFIERYCHKVGDIAEHTGNRAGEVRHDKKGDCIVCLGPDAEAAGARIVCEMKEDASYDLRRSLSDLEGARTNRKADVGLFIHSAKTAPAQMQPLARYKNNVVVIWDADDENSDCYLMAALMICRALAARQNAGHSELAADFDALERAIREVERQAAFLEEIRTSSETVKSGAIRILDRVERMRAALAKQIQVLDEQAGLLRTATGMSGALASL